MTPQDIKTALQDLSVALDVVLPIAGHGELVPIANAITELAVKVTSAIADRERGATVLATEIATADAAADAAEKAKFP